MNYEILDEQGNVIATRVPESDLEAWLAEGNYSFRPQAVRTQEERTAQGLEESKAMNQNIASAQQGVMDQEKAQQTEYDTMMGNIAKAQSDVMADEYQNDSFLGRFAKSGLSTIAPYKTELYQSNPDPSYLQRFGANARDFTALASNAMLPTAGLAKLLGLGAVNVANDISAQADYGKLQDESGDFAPEKLGTLRNVLNIGFNALPVAPELGGALKWLGKTSVTNTFLPPSRMTSNPNPPDFGIGLDQNLFSGFGKYSSLDKIKSKTDPIIARLEDLKSQGKMVDIEEARKNSLNELREQMKGAGENDIAQAKAELNSWFDGEKNKYKTVTPEVTHFESQFDPTAFETARRATKAQETRARNQWLKSSDPDALPPFIQYPKKTESSFWDVAEVVDQPEKTQYLYDVPKALEKKSFAQKQAYSVPDAIRKQGKAQDIATSRGINQAIETSAPEVRQASRELAPYYAMKDAIENRQKVGGSNAPISLKDIAYASQFNPLLFFPALLGSKFVRSPQGAQTAFNIGKAIQREKKPAGLASIVGQRTMPSWLNNEGE